jgi:hypothetical protein
MLTSLHCAPFSKILTVYAVNRLYGGHGAPSNVAQAEFS